MSRHKPILIKPSNKLDYTIGVKCQKENEWCLRYDSHAHGSRCHETCPCWMPKSVK